TISPCTKTSTTACLPPGADAVTRAWPYPVAEIVPSSATATAGGLSEAKVTAVAGPITVPVSSAKLARNPYRRLSGRPSRVTVSWATVLCTTMSTLLVCSSPDTDSVVLPGATAVTTPVSDTRATFGSADAHCIVRGLTTRFPCPGTITCSVSTSLGPSVTGLGSWIAMSLGCTTTGAVAVSPVELVTCTVPWPADSATITPFWSTLAISGRSDFHVTATGAAGE